MQQRKHLMARQLQPSVCSPRISLLPDAGAHPPSGPGDTALPVLLNDKPSPLPSPPLSAFEMPTTGLGAGPGPLYVSLCKLFTQEVSTSQA